MSMPRLIARGEHAAARNAGGAEPAFLALVSTFGLLKRVMEPYFAHFGVSGAQWGVLRTLQRLEDDGEPEPRLTDLGHHLLVRPPSMTGVIDRLERLGLVRRSASATDQRAKHVSLTQAGRALVERVLERHHAQINAVLGGLGPDEQSQLQVLLSRLETHLQSMAERTEANGIIDDDNGGNGLAGDEAHGVANGAGGNDDGLSL
jgi:DNA-binding MarR family transcriptional regulator